MPSFTSFEGQLKNVVYGAVDMKELYTQYTFIDTVNVLKAFLVFESMRRHSSVTGVLDYSHFLRAIDDGIGPATLFDVED